MACEDRLNIVVKPIYRTALALMAVVFAVALVYGSCDGSSSRARLVEVKEYQGQHLGSVRDFRENSIKGPQKVDSANYRLRVGGLVRKPMSLTLDQALKLPSDKRIVKLDCVEGWSVRILWEGIRLSALFDSAGVDSGANTVIFHGVDGYTTSLPLSYVRGRDLILAHKMNGAVMPVERGYPFELVAEDKWGYKWIRWVDGFELSADSVYRGYWEKRGYNQKGDITGPIFEGKGPRWIE